VFDQFTGATITPRAVVKSVYNALVYFEKHKDALLQQATEKDQTITDTITDTLTDKTVSDGSVNGGEK